MQCDFGQKAGARKKGNDTMKMYKRLLALGLALGMLFGLAACDQQNDKEEEASPSAEATGAPADEAQKDISADLPAIELGDQVTTVGDIQDAYEYFVSYMSYYGMEAPTEESEIKQYRDMVVEQALSDMVLPWKAKELGLSLDAADDDQIDEQVEAHRAEILQEYKEYARQQLGESATEEEVDKSATETLESEVASYYNCTFEEYLSTIYRPEMEKTRLSEKVEEYFLSTVKLEEGDAQSWFAQELTDQQSAVASDPLSYRTTQQAYESGESQVPGLSVPEGFTRVQVIRLALSEADQAVYNENLAKMTALEAEYGAIVLKGENTVRQQEIQAEYAALSTANRELLKSLQEKGSAALQEIESGKDFGLVMKDYASSAPTDAQMAFGDLLYTLEKDSNFDEEIWNKVLTMKAGEVSDLMEVSSVFYILKRGDDVVAGDRTYEQFQEAAEAAALKSKKDSEWSAVQSSWLEEARSAAVFHEDNYKNVG